MHLLLRYWFKRKRFKLNRILGSKRNAVNSYMQKNPQSTLLPSVDEVVARIADALGPGWMTLMEVQPETVRTWRKRGEVPVKQLLRAARHSGRTVEHFSAQAGAESRAESTQVYQDDGEFTQIEVLDACMSAGNGATNGEQEVLGRLAFRTAWLRSKGLNRNNAKIVRVRGNSMSDRINDGDILLVDTSVQSLSHDGVYVIELEGEDYVKLLQRDFSTGGVRVISYNPDYPVQTLEAETANRLRITGRVVWHGGEI